MHFVLLKDKTFARGTRTVLCPHENWKERSLPVRQWQEVQEVLCRRDESVSLRLVPASGPPHEGRRRL